MNNRVAQILVGLSVSVKETTASSGEPMARDDLTEKMFTEESTHEVLLLCHVTTAKDMFFYAWLSRRCVCIEKDWEKESACLCKILALAYMG